MKILNLLFVLLLFTSCESQELKSLEAENARLQAEIDSLTVLLGKTREMLEISRMEMNARLKDMAEKNADEMKSQ